MGGKIIANNGVPSGIMSGIGLDETVINNARESWQAAQTGQNAFKTAFINGNEWKYTPISLNFEQMEFLKTRAFQRAQIAAMFGVPPHLIGDTTRQSNTNSEQESLSLVQFTLRPYLVKIENELQRTLLPSVGRNANKYFVEFDVRDLLRGDAKTTNESLSLARQWGWMNTNEIRNELGMNPVGPVGDVYWVPVNMTNAENLLKDPEPQNEEQWAQPATVEDTTPPLLTDGKDDDESKPTADERSIVQRASALTVVFRDSIGRLLNRETRDFGTISTIFEPALRSILGFAIDDANKKLGTIWSDQKASDRIISDVLKGIEKRSTDYKLADAETVSADEFRRALKGIVANIYRECAASTVQ